MKSYKYAQLDFGANESNEEKACYLRNTQH